MKKISRYIILALVIVFTSACDPDDLPTQTAQELAFEKLSGNWSMQGTNAILVDGQDISLNYPGLTLSFNDGGYTTINAGDLFRAMGTWQWANEEAGQITLDDGKEIMIVSLTENLFNFTFSFGGTGGVANGVNGLAGNYNITMVK